MGRYLRITERQITRIRYLYDAQKLSATVIAIRTGLRKAQVCQLLDQAHKAEQERSNPR